MTREIDEPGKIRRRIQLLKELPPLPAMAQKILSLSNDDTDITELAAAIEKDPPLSARIIGLANSAYFAWPGGVCTIYDAVYKVLGIRMVKSLAIGLILGGVFRVGKNMEYPLRQYWFTAVATAILSQKLFPHVSAEIKDDIDNIYMDGLLHNLGFPVLAHLFPKEMEQVFSGETDRDVFPSDAHMGEVVGIEPCRAGGLLARKWHLPEDIVNVIEHHADPGYRDEYWPITLLVGYCARHAGLLFSGKGSANNPEFPAVLGINEAIVEKGKQMLVKNIEGIDEMALLLSGNGSGNG
jgi:HD-like signal output (HDOD) protein